MKKNHLFRPLWLFLVLVILSAGKTAAQNSQEIETLMTAGKKTKENFIKTDPTISRFFSGSYGYVIFPRNGKGGLIIGGSGGNGVVYEEGKAIGTSKMAQVSVGAQIGGASYSEVIFFENKDALDRFRDNKFEFSSQVSAVALKSGVSKDAKYANGVTVFTQDLSGLLAEATVGGQKFTYKPF
jgi:lipid-binding SYLF domain-containing protein